MARGPIAYYPPPDDDEGGMFDLGIKIKRGEKGYVVSDVESTDAEGEIAVG